MKIILLQDVAKLGKKNSVVDAPNGYVMNTLLPSGKAIPATKQNLEKLEKIQSQKDSVEEQKLEQLQTAHDDLQAQTVAVPVEANEKDQLFQALSADQVATAIAELGIDLPKEFIVIPDTIKELGEHTIKLSYGETELTLEITVVKK